MQNGNVAYGVVMPEGTVPFQFGPVSRATAPLGLSVAQELLNEYLLEKGILVGGPIC